MTVPEEFDAQRVCEIAAKISDKVSSIATLKVEADRARDDLNSAQTDLLNLRSELTRLVKSQLDWLLMDRPFGEAVGR